MTDPAEATTGQNGAAGPRGGRNGRASVLLAAPAFLAILLAAYGLSRGLAQALGPLDRWLAIHVVEPARDTGSQGTGRTHDGP